MASARTPRGAWIEAALRALAGGGPRAVRIEALAAELGVSKGGFYWHFKDRAALLSEALAQWERAGTEDVIARIEALDADPRARLRRLFALAPTAEFEVELAIRDWSRRDAAVAARVRRVDARRLRFLRALFARLCEHEDEDEVDARVMLAYSLLIGSWFIVQPRGSRTRAQMLELAVERLLA